MNVSSVTKKRFKGEELAEGFRVFAWSALTVTLEAESEDKYYQVELTEEELRAALKKIHDRKAEIRKIQAEYYLERVKK